MIALIPLSRFRVNFEVASGRPYSQLEGLALRAISEGASTIDALREIFQIHPRLLIEAVVTLTQAGWVAVSSFEGRGFLLTAEGQEAVKSGRPPESLGINARKSYIVMERVSGGLIPSNEVRFASRRDLDDIWDDCFRLRTDVADNDLDEGQVQNYIPRRNGEWLRWVGPIEMVSKGNHWLPVNVDLRSGNVVGLPDAWIPRLRFTVLEGAERFASRLNDAARTRSWSIASRPRRDEHDRDPDAPVTPTTSWAAAVRREDLLLSQKEHEEYLTLALSESDAESSLLIASAFLTLQRLDEIGDLLGKAVDRGVNVDLLWGYSAGTGSKGDDAREWLKKFAFGCKQRKARGSIRFNVSPSESHAKLVLWSRGAMVEGCVGSFNWLSSATTPMAVAEGDHGPINASIRVSNTGIVAALCRCGAALWTGAESEALSSTGDRWRRAASELERQFATTAAPSNELSGEPRVRLVIDRDHESLLREWILTAQRRVLIASHQLGLIADNRLSTAQARRAGHIQYGVFYGTTKMETAAIEKLEAQVRSVGGTMTQIKGLHAKVLVSDISTCISSYNYLSADPFGTASRARELGVVIEGAEVSDWVWNWLYPGQLDRLTFDQPTGAPGNERAGESASGGTQRLPSGKPSA